MNPKHLKIAQFCGWKIGYWNGASFQTLYNHEKGDYAGLNDFDYSSDWNLFHEAWTEFRKQIESIKLNDIQDLELEHKITMLSYAALAYPTPAEATDALYDAIIFFESIKK